MLPGCRRTRWVRRRRSCPAESWRPPCLPGCSSRACRSWRARRSRRPGHHRVDPGGFGGGRRFELGDAVCKCPCDDPGGVACLHVEQIGEVHRQPGLGDAFDEAVRETVGAQTLKRAHAVVPPLGERHAVAADQLESGAAAVVGAHLETRCEDQAVELVGHPVDHHTGFGDALHPEAPGVDQGHVVAVERLQVLVVEAGPLAEVAVPGFERLCGGAVGDDVGDAGPDLLHLGEVRQFRCRARARRRLRRCRDASPEACG